MIVVVFLLAFRASADESFTLTIPQRFDASQEIGEVRILLGLNSAPAAAQLVVGGSVTVALGTTASVAGDSVSFETATGNRVMIRYRPLSNFAGDFCSGAAAVEKNVAVRFVGAQDVVDYRMSSFVVGAPAAECSNVSRRVADLAATITPNADGVAPALTAGNAGRLPIDVVLVLDKSGSIAGVPPDAGAGSTTKEMILKAATDAFVAGWQEIDAPDNGPNSEDRIAVIFFDASAVPQTLAGADPPANVFLRRVNGWGAAITAIDALSPGNSTSIGAGINAAMAQWKADPANDVMLIVVTDGMQNTAPLVTAAPSGFLGLPAVAGLPVELRQRFIPIQTIGFGTPATVDENLIRNISFETAGRSYMSVNATTMYDVFAMTLVSILKGNTASIVTRRTATPTPRAPVATHSLVLDKSPRRVVFALQWTPPLTEAFRLEVVKPGASQASTPTHSRTLPQAELQTFDKPDAGTWKVRVRRSPGLRDNVPYTLNVFVSEKSLDYRVSLAPESVIVGRPQQLRAEISWDGKPLTGLPAGAIKVRVLRPKHSLASVLRESKGRPPEPTKGDPQTKDQLAVMSLSPTDVAKLLPVEAETLTLREEKRGVYTVPVAKAAIAGSYAYEVVLDWNDRRTGRVHREERIEQYVGEKR